MQKILPKLEKMVYNVVATPYDAKGMDLVIMKLPRSKIITKIIVFALIVYAGISLIAIRGRIEAARDDLGEVRREVAELEVSNAELEYEIENYNNPDVIAGIARSSLGLVLPGEIVFFDGGSGTDPAD